MTRKRAGFVLVLGAAVCVAGYFIAHARPEDLVLTGVVIWWLARPKQADPVKAFFTVEKK